MYDSSQVKAAIQLEMDSLFEAVDEKPVSKQAFSKRRKDIDPEYIRTYADEVSEFHAADEDRLMYKGMTVVAINGSDISLPNSKELLEHYGGSGPKKNAPTALASMAYVPLNSCVYDFRLDKYATDERTLAQTHMERLKELGLAIVCFFLIDGILPRNSLPMRLLRDFFHYAST